MTKYVNETIELDKDTYDELMKIAKENNATLDEVVTDIIRDHISVRMPVSEFVKLPEKEMSGFYILLDKDGKELCRVEPLE